MLARYLGYKAGCKPPSFTRAEGVCSFLFETFLAFPFKFAACPYPAESSSLAVIIILLLFVIMISNCTTWFLDFKALSWAPGKKNSTDYCFYMPQFYMSYLTYLERIQFSERPTVLWKQKWHCMGIRLHLPPQKNTLITIMKYHYFTLGCV